MSLGPWMPKLSVKYCPQESRDSLRSQPSAPGTGPTFWERCMYVPRWPCANAVIFAASYTSALKCPPATPLIICPTCRTWTGPSEVQSPPKKIERALRDSRKKVAAAQNMNNEEDDFEANMYVFMCRRGTIVPGVPRWPARNLSSTLRVARR